MRPQASKPAAKAHFGVGDTARVQHGLSRVTRSRERGRAAGTGTSTAISSAVSVTPCYAASVFCFKPVSPFTQYAMGNTLKTGCTYSLVDMFARRQSASADDSCAVAEMISDACSGRDQRARVVEADDLVVRHESLLLKVEADEGRSRCRS
jgi:hypothetical protein